jgi:hypothetical protein
MLSGMADKEQDAAARAEAARKYEQHIAERDAAFGSMANQKTSGHTPFSNPDVPPVVNQNFFSLIPEDSSKQGWGFLWAGTGACAVIALVAAPGLLGPIVFVLTVIAGISFTAAAHCFGKLRAHPVGMFLLIWLGVALLGYVEWPAPTGRHLTPEQRLGLAQIRTNLPKDCGMLVYVPTESKESQSYGKEIQTAFQRYGDKANLVYAGAMEPPVGIVVGVRSQLTPCGQAGETVAIQMTQLGVPARMQDVINDSDSVILVFVGTKPPYD